MKKGKGPLLSKQKSNTYAKNSNVWEYKPKRNIINITHNIKHIKIIKNLKFREEHLNIINLRLQWILLTNNKSYNPRSLDLKNRIIISNQWFTMGREVLSTKSWGTSCQCSKIRWSHTKQCLNLKILMETTSSKICGPKEANFKMMGKDFLELRASHVRAF